MGMSTTCVEKAYIREQIDAIQATRIMEIGAFKGETTRVLSEAAGKRNGFVVAIDPMQWASEIVHNGITRHVGEALRPMLERAARWLPLISYERAFRREVKKSGFDNVRLFRHLSTDPALIAQEDPELSEIDLLFIDGDHSFFGASADLENWGRRVRPGGRILVHDAIPRFKGVCDAIGKLEADPTLRVSPERHGSICTIDVLMPSRSKHTSLRRRSRDVAASLRAPETVL